MWFHKATGLSSTMRPQQAPQPNRLHSHADPLQRSECREPSQPAHRLPPFAVVAHYRALGAQQSPSTLELANPFFMTPAFENARMCFNKRPVTDSFGDPTRQFIMIDSIRRISPERDQRTSRGLRRYIAAPAPLPDGRPPPVGTRNRVRKTSRPTTSVEPPSPPAGSNRSSTVGMPNLRTPPSGLGISTRLPGFAS